MSRTSFTPLRLSLLLATLPALLSATGCQGFTDPSPMPRGYVFHRNEYKTIPDSKPDSIGTPYTLLDTAKATASWRAAARDLVTRMATRGALPLGPVFVSPLTPKEPIAAAFDYALRGVLLEKGYTLTTTPEQSAILSYEIARVDDSAAPAPEETHRPPAPPKPAPAKPVPAKAPPAPPIPGADDIIKVEIAPEPAGNKAPTPIDLPPQTIPAPPAAPMAEPPAFAPPAPPPQPVVDDLRLSLMTMTQEKEGKALTPRDIQSGTYVIPGADSYDWHKPLINWKAVTWGLR